MNCSLTLNQVSVDAIFRATLCAHICFISRLTKEGLATIMRLNPALVNEITLKQTQGFATYAAKYGEHMYLNKCYALTTPGLLT